jgi:hypothetical protein
VAQEKTGESESNVPGGRQNAAEPGGALLSAFASSSLTLWLIALLVIAMAGGTLIPQGATLAQYRHAFGAALGGYIARSTLSNVYGSWWFVALFVMLWINLLACAIRRVGMLMGGKQADAVASWGVVAAHCGVLIILIGAAYGRWPSRAYSDVAALRPGEQHRVPAAAGGFAVRLLAAGSKQDARGRATDFWARAQLVENGRVLRTVTIRPNQPLRYKAVSVVLQSLPAPDFAIEVRRGSAVSRVPIVLDENGEVAIRESIGILRDPKWLVFAHRLREEGGRPSAMVVIGTTGKPGHNWEPVGWVDERGLNFRGVALRLTRGNQGAQLSLDRDVGIPIVWAGFALLTVGSLLACSKITKRGDGKGAQ